MDVGGWGGRTTFFEWVRGLGSGKSRDFLTGATQIEGAGLKRKYTVRPLP
jgi:hypothetical protein